MPNLGGEKPPCLPSSRDESTLLLNPRLLHLHRHWRKGSVCSPRAAPRLAQQLLPVMRFAEANRPPPAAVAPSVPTAWSLPSADELKARIRGPTKGGRRSRPHDGSAARVRLLAAAAALAASAARAVGRSTASAAAADAAAATPPVPLGGFDPSQQQCPPDARSLYGIRLECPWCAHPTPMPGPDVRPSKLAIGCGARPASTSRARIRSLIALTASPQPAALALPPSAFSPTLPPSALAQLPTPTPDPDQVLAQLSTRAAAAYLRHGARTAHDNERHDAPPDTPAEQPL